MRHTAVILTLGRLRQEDLKFNSSLSYIVSSRLASSNTKGGKRLKQSLMADMH